VESVDHRELRDQERNEILRPFTNDFVKRFVFGPVEVCTLASADDVDFRYDLNRRITRVPGAINLVVSCHGLNTRMRFTGEAIERDGLDLAATTFYSFDHLRDWFTASDFDVQWCLHSDGMGFFLLRKR
jgi:hypothetical protein